MRDTRHVTPRTSDSYRTTAAYVSGGICGSLYWLIGAPGGKPINLDIRPQIRRFGPNSSGVTFRDVLDHLLMEHGGDFQSARFTADTVIRVERRRMIGPTTQAIHVFERPILEWSSADLADFADPDTFTADVMGEN